MCCSVSMGEDLELMLDELVRAELPKTIPLSVSNKSPTTMS